MSLPYANSKHYLHRAYRNGYIAYQNDDDDCPHVVGSREWEWWWAGWGS